MIVTETNYGPGVNERRAANLAATISKKITCQKPTFVYRHIEDNISTISACDKTYEYALECSGFCFWLSLDDLKKRAAFDLNCSSAISIEKIADRVWGVKGCNNRATYIPMRASGSMAWIQNSSSNTHQSVINAEDAATDHLMHHTPPPPPVY